MRILRVRFAGIGPYREEQTIDFEGLEDDGIYLIAGRTGAGKSTILDAICFALYGSVPRFEGGPSNLRSDHSGPEDPSFSELEFEAGAGRYRLYRSPEYQRPAKRGGGLTKNPAKANLAVWRDGAWEGVSTSAREIGDEVLALVGLTKDQFLQVILLAQNRFHEFLLAKNDDRQRLLRSLFATERFDRLRKQLIEKRQTMAVALEAESTIIAQLAKEAADLAGIDEPIAPDAEWFASLPEALAPRVSAAAELAAQTDDRLIAATAVRDDALRIRRLQQRRATAQRDRAALTEQEGEVVELRASVAAARRADVVWPLLAAERRAEAEAETSRLAAERADVELESVAGPELDPAAVAEAATAGLGAIDGALADEARVPSARRAVSKAVSARDRADESIAAQERALAELPGRLDANEEELRLRRASAERREQHDAAVTGLRTRATAAVELDTARTTHAERNAAYVIATEKHAAATRRHADLVAERFSGFAAELAERLQPGEPCSVCGSIEHPAPAAHEGTRSVTPDEIDASWTEVERLATLIRSALEASTVAGERVASLAAVAGDESAEALAAELIAAETARSEAVRAEAAVVKLEKQRARMLRERDDLTTALDSARRGRTELAETATAAETELAALLVRVEAHRDGYATVAERASMLRHRRDVATAAVTARAALLQRAEALASAGRAAQEQLDASGFATREEAAAAHLDAAAVARHVARIDGHAERVATVNAILAEEELADLPDEPVDLTDAEASVVAARTERDAALAHHAALAGDADRLHNKAEAAVQRVGRSAHQLRSFEELRALSEAVDGKGQNTRRMDLEAFALAGRLEEIVDAANARLAAMTTGRYSLEHDDSLAYRGAASGLGLVVFDAYTGARRAPASLSGGETFLASLALALGLADAVTAQAGGITLDTMFIDEGFGSLDPETLEIAMSTLDGLRAGGRTVGLISHVEVMKERIPVGLQVEVTDRGDSRIRVA
ncbi:SMC family ATPase [Microbacteriaceae bacterium VKM Ac-2854]|nr:SMC family ATPase [Microbacteriaceae bacterium VKM Ac-2854]